MAKAKKKKNGVYDTDNSINNLIILGIYFATKEREKCTFEKLIKECFTHFPKTFGFRHYPKWPDARKLDRPLRELRKNKLITGSPKTFFTLTQQGRKFAEIETITLQQKKLSL